MIFVEINPTPKSMALIYAFSFNGGSLLTNLIYRISVIDYFVLLTDDRF